MVVRCSLAYGVVVVSKIYSDKEYKRRWAMCGFFFFQAEDGIRDLVRSRGLGDVYKRQHPLHIHLQLQTIAERLL